MQRVPPSLPPSVRPGAAIARRATKKGKEKDSNRLFALSCHVPRSTQNEKKRNETKRNPMYSTSDEIRNWRDDIKTCTLYGRFRLFGLTNDSLIFFSSSHLFDEERHLQGEGRVVLGAEVLQYEPEHFQTPAVVTVAGQNFREHRLCAPMYIFFVMCSVHSMYQHSTNGKTCITAKRRKRWTRSSDIDIDID